MMVLMSCALLSEKWGSCSHFHTKESSAGLGRNGSVDNSKYNFNAQPNGRPVRYAHSTPIRYRIRNVLTFLNTTVVAYCTGKK